MKNLILILPYIIIVILIVLFVKTNSELNLLKTEHDKVAEVYEKKIEELTAGKKSNSESNNVNLTDFYIERFKQKGLSNPVQDIISDLTNHPELIPYEAEHGGKMQFYDKMIWILNNKWVLAYFEDGHFAGYLLLEYDITAEGVKWKRIASMM